MNGAIIVVDYILQMKEQTGRFGFDDALRAKDLLSRFEGEMLTDDYNYTLDIIYRLFEAFNGGAR